MKLKPPQQYTLPHTDSLIHLLQFSLVERFCDAYLNSNNKSTYCIKWNKLDMYSVLYLKFHLGLADTVNMIHLYNIKQHWQRVHHLEKNAFLYPLAAAGCAETFFWAGLQFASS